MIGTLIMENCEENAYIIHKNYKFIEKLNLINKNSNPNFIKEK